MSASNVWKREPAAYRLLVGLAVLAFSAWPVSAQQRESGEITANDVYVRSGPSTNHYTICKLNAGDQVTVVGEEGEWFEILPPREVFSLISGDFVDTADSKSGVVNGDNVRVRAGSSLNENKYTVQTMLNKGATVSILGANPDGFLRITPPPDATVWVSKAYVAMLGGSAGSGTGSEFKSPEDPDTKASNVLGAPVSPDTGTRATVRRTDTGELSRGITPGPAGAYDHQLDTLPHSDQLRRLKAAESELRQEMTKPLYERTFDGLIGQYQQIAAAGEDEIVTRYAEGRVTQLSELKGVVETAGRLRTLDEEAELRRQRFMEERARIPKYVTAAPGALDAQGELRESALFAATSIPRRLRLVDPMHAPPRTIAYVEVPPGVVQDLQEYLGRYVGIRASSKRVPPGGVDPVPIYVASEIIMLQRPGAGEAAGEG